MEELIKKTETMLRAVLISSPRGVPLYRLDREYRSITFESIPYSKCGFKTLEEFIRRIPKVARIEKDRDGETVVKGVPSEADQHVAKLIAKQKKPKLKKSASRPARRPMLSSLRFNTPAKSYTSRFGPRSMQFSSPFPKPVPASIFTSSSSSATTSRARNTPKFVPPRLARKVIGSAQPENRSVSGGTHRIVTVGSSAVPDERPKPPVPSTKRTVKPKGLNFAGMEISVSRSPPQSPSTKQQELGKSLSPEVLERIGNIAGHNTNGYFLTRLPIVYKEKYQTDLPSNVAELLSNYPHIVHLENKLGNIYIAYPPKVNKIPPATVTSNKIQETKEIEPQRKVIELYTVKPYTVPALGIPVQVYVSHIEKVNHFYVQYKENETEIDTLQERLAADMKDSSEYIAAPTRGMHCCAQFSQDNGWYRGQILECLQDKIQKTKSVNVFYVDFGNSEWLPHTRLRYLRREHVELPKMAIHCSLHGISSDDTVTQEKLTNLLDKESTMTVVERVGEVLYVRLTNEEEVNIAASPKKVEDTPQTKEEKAIPQTKEEKPIPQTKEEKPMPQPKEERPIPQTKEEKPMTGQAPDTTSPEQKKPAKPFLMRKSVSVEQERKLPERVVIPADADYIDIMVSSVFSTDNISVMLYGEEYSDKLLSLEISMMSYFIESTDSEDNIPVVGELYALKSSELHSEDQYYRVKVISIQDNQAMLEFVDYGDTRKATLSSLQSLPARFMELPFQAFTISLYDIPRTKKKSVLDKLKQYVLGKALVAEVFKRTQSKLEVEIFDTSTEQDLNINEVMRSLIIPDEDLCPALPKGNHQVKARISHITNTGNVFVQIPGAGLNRLEELMTDITEHYSKSTKAAEFVSNPTEGHICCVKCSDGSWYRAVILEQLPDRKVKVQCVDYGNTEVLARTTLREPTKANEHVNLLPFQAKECHLHGIEEGSWNAEKTAKMNELVSEDVILEVTKHDTIPTVKVYLTTDDDQQINIVDFILDELSTSKSDSSQSSTAEQLEQTEKESSSQEDDQDDSTPDLPPLITLSRPWVDVTISDIIDPGHFMFQPLEMIKQLEEMTNKMTEQYMSNSEADHLVSPRNGDVCAVRFTDGQFYRAIVKAVLSPQQICVLFIDYGNLGIHSSKDFRVLLDEYKQMPAVAVKGCLAGVNALDNSGEWSDSAKKRFEELSLWKMLVASVDGDQYKYDFREDLKVPLNLFDTSMNDNDLNIADVLLTEGLARKLEQ